MSKFLSRKQENMAVFPVDEGVYDFDSISKLYAAHGNFIKLRNKILDEFQQKNGKPSNE